MTQTEEILKAANALVTEAHELRAGSKVSFAMKVTLTNHMQEINSATQQLTTATRWIQDLLDRADFVNLGRHAIEAHAAQTRIAVLSTCLASLMLAVKES